KMTENTSANEDREQKPADRRQRYADIGARLRKQRQALSLSQKDMARRLRLPGIVVNDIETGQIEQLSSIYRRGYIRNYAQALDLDAEVLLVDAGADSPPELKAAFPVAPQREWQFERYLKIATYAIVTVAIIPPLVYFFIAGGMRILDRDPGVGPNSVAVRSDTPSGHDQRAAADHGEESGKQADRRRPAASAGHVSASAIPLKTIRPVSETIEGPVL